MTRWCAPVHACWSTLAAAAVLLGGCAAGDSPARGDSPADDADGDGEADGGGGGDGGQSQPVSTDERAQWVRDEVTRVNADLAAADRAEKFAAMAESPARFFRATNHLFWADLAADDRLARYGRDDTRSFILGDLHADNVGALTDDEGRVIYDLDDVDDAFIADYQLDLWRMAVSIALVGRENGVDGQSVADAVAGFAGGYLTGARAFVGNGDEDDAVVDSSNAFGILDEFLADAEEETRADLLADLTVVVDGARQLDTDRDDLDPPAPDLADALVAAMPAYGETLSGQLPFDPDYFAVKSIARRLHAGLSSLGRPRYLVLIEGPSDADDDDVVLEAKNIPAPTPYGFVSDDERARYDASFANHAERALQAARALGAHVDDHLGWMALPDGDFLVRERTPAEDTLDTADLDSPTRLGKLAEQWGAIAAAAHARGDDDFRPDLVAGSLEAAVDRAVGGDDDGFAALILEVAEGYADQVAIDFESFLPLADDVVPLR